MEIFARRKISPPAFIGDILAGEPPTTKIKPTEQYSMKIWWIDLNQREQKY